MFLKVVVVDVQAFITTLCSPIIICLFDLDICFILCKDYY